MKDVIKFGCGVVILVMFCYLYFGVMLKNLPGMPL